MPTQQNKNREYELHERIATGLGWFSIGLGLWEVIAPASLARVIGVKDESANRKLLRFYGFRELAAGIGILSQSQPAGWLWARVAGDAVDLGSLAKPLISAGEDRTKLAIAAAAVAGVTALDVYCSRQISEQKGWKTQPVRTAHSIIIHRSAEDLYKFWHDFQNFPSFMDHIESIRIMDDTRSHWTVKAPAGRTVEWDAEIVDDVPNGLISWRSLPGADVQNSGTVRFVPMAGNRGTMVRVEIQYTPPGGAIGAQVAKLMMQEPGTQLKASLHALKQIMETGEVTKSDSSIHKGMHPAQPSPPDETQRLSGQEHKGSANLQPTLV